MKDSSKTVTDDNIQIYRFSRVPFGIIASPFLLARSIQHHLKNNKFATKILKELYVKNLISGENSPEKAWNTKKDHSFKQESTKHQILKRTAGVFDPLSLFIPVLLKPKPLHRELWKEEKDCDDPTTVTQQKRWTRISKDLEELHSVKLLRFIGERNSKLVCFTDASGQGYAVTVDLPTKKDGKLTTDLVFSKSRIAPNKPTTIPRMELLGAVIEIRALKFVESSLQIPIEKKILWTDPTCVLDWINTTISCQRL